MNHLPEDFKMLEDGGWSWAGSCTLLHSAGLYCGRIIISGAEVEECIHWPIILSISAESLLADMHTF